jgi:hypothetical protein
VPLAGRGRLSCPVLVRKSTKLALVDRRADSGGVTMVGRRSQGIYDYGPQNFPPLPRRLGRRPQPFEARRFRERFGERGAHVTVGTSGVTETVGLLGTGV